MTTAGDFLPLTESFQPANQRELAEQIAVAYRRPSPVYPIGGGTSLDYGLPARQPGMGLEIRNLSRVVDYPARDMTITVEAGITVERLAEVLAPERQEFAVDVPRPGLATLGGVIATNFNGLRRYGCGAIRDQVIGIRAVDGRGATYNGGGRVVKNVAGYDFCKLLTGSLGTLGVVTQVTLKLKPLAEQRSLFVCYPRSLEVAESVLGAIECEPITPVAIELLAGPEAVTAPLDPSRKLALVIAFEGTAVEVDWSLAHTLELARRLGVTDIDSPFAAVEPLWQHLRDFPVLGSSPIVARGSMVPSGLARFIPQVWEIDEQCSVQAHAGSGTFILRFSRIPPAGLSRTLVAQLQASAARFHGHLGVLSNPGHVEVTRQSTWGAGQVPLRLMALVKKQFDPANILNPGRFVYD